MTSLKLHINHYFLDIFHDILQIWFHKEILLRIMAKFRKWIQLLRPGWCLASLEGSLSQRLRVSKLCNCQWTLPSSRAQSQDLANKCADQDEMAAGQGLAVQVVELQARHPSGILTSDHGLHRVLDVPFYLEIIFSSWDIWPVRTSFSSCSGVSQDMLHILGFHRTRNLAQDKKLALGS